ncbi:hypothetical protein BDV24DRAFT_97610 [Aspergillus arachidicola]|uniref:Uncharacterized protein n=1 Tax=Aspergillus arachidicola TaxID=656916 RepID=A0A5N6XWR6_9EURO|nr:hypothetical protein BDV24DRAFT_97610 [Aspergillus arachidicola]
MAPVWYFVCCLYHHVSVALLASNPPVQLFPFFLPFTFSYLKVDMYDDELRIHVLMTCPFFSFFFPPLFSDIF